MFTVIPPDNKSVLVEERGHRGHEGHDDPYRPAERLKDSIASSLSQVLEQIGNSVVAVEKNGRSGELATEKVGSAGQLATEKTASAVGAANSINFANTQNMLVTGFKDGRYDAATLTASILHGQVTGFKDARYDAATDTAALQASIAKCCCELKSLIMSESCETRQLISSIDGRRADRELVDAKGEVTLLKLQLSRPGTVVVS